MTQPSPSPSAPMTGESLVVRQHERHTCRLSAAVSVSSESEVRVTLSRAAGNGTGVVPATVVDCSAGGIGLEMTVFFPRGAELSVRIQRPTPATGEASAAGDAIELAGTVQRVEMLSRGPKYYLGMAFKGRRAPARSEVARVLEWARIGGDEAHAEVTHVRA